MEKKLRTILIVLSIAISSAIFFSSVALSNSLVKMFEERMKQFYGNTHIVIETNEKSKEPFFSMTRAKKIMHSAEYIVGAIVTTGIYKYGENELVDFRLQGIDIDDLQRINPFKFSDSCQINQFIGKQIIISSYTAKKYSLKLKDTITLEINGKKEKFVINGIANPTGPFTNSTSLFAVVPIDALQHIYLAENRVNTIYIKLKDENDKQKYINELGKLYNGYSVREAISKEEYKRNLSGISLAFLLMSMVVSLISVFIIYSSFKVIVMDRIPVIGTFRSIGATRKMMNFLLLAESLVYGLVGGILGFELGNIILYTIVYFMTSSGVKSTVTINYNISQILMTFAIAILLCFMGSIFPINKICKIPIKDIILNEIAFSKNKTRIKPVLGSVFLICSVVLPVTVPKQIALNVDLMCILLCIIAVIMLVDTATNLFVKLFEKIYTFIFSNEGIIAAKNLRENRSIINNISLLTMGIAVIMMIFVTSNSMIEETSYAFTKSTNFDIMMSAQNADRNLENIVRKIDGVSDTCGIYQVHDVKVTNKDSRIAQIDSIDKSMFPEYRKFNVYGDYKSILERLDKERSILLTKALKDQFDVEIGDILWLEMPKGKYAYKVVGFFNSLINSGDYALISSKYLKADTGSKYYSAIYVKTSDDPEKIALKIRNELVKYKAVAKTVKQIEYSIKSSTAQILAGVQGFSVLSFLIGVLGVVNNLLVSFIERKRILAMFRSIGMSKAQNIKIIFIDAFTGGLIGGILGVSLGILMISIVSKVLYASYQPIPINYSLTVPLIFLTIGICIYILASISPALKSSRLNILESLKYE